MARKCELSGKAPLSGHTVSHSNKKIKRKFYPNLQKKRIYVPEEDRWVSLKISTSALKTINKKGLSAYLKGLKKKGKEVKI